MNKKITLLFAVIWILTLCAYSSALIGILAHELIHKENAFEMKAIEINYDSSGVAYGNFKEHSHSDAYIKGNTIFLFMLVISALCILIIGKGGK